MSGAEYVGDEVALCVMHRLVFVQQARFDRETDRRVRHRLEVSRPRWPISRIIESPT